MKPPASPKIYHIVHVDRLASIIGNGFLWCDAIVQQRNPPGTTIGMSNIKQRRLTSSLNSHSGLHVGDCVPFYFCPRSVMLYVIHAKSNQLTYQGGQKPVVHLEADLNMAVQWANQHNLRWAFTKSNAGSNYFIDYSQLSQLGQVNWAAVTATYWKNCQDEKQAEFLIEDSFPWSLVQRVGVYSKRIHKLVSQTIMYAGHKPSIQVIKRWYY